VENKGIPHGLSTALQIRVGGRKYLKVEQAPTWESAMEWIEADMLGRTWLFMVLSMESSGEGGLCYTFHLLGGLQSMWFILLSSLLGGKDDRDEWGLDMDGRPQRNETATSKRQEFSRQKRSHTQGRGSSLHSPTTISTTN